MLWRGLFLSFPSLSLHPQGKLVGPCPWGYLPVGTRVILPADQESFIPLATGCCLSLGLGAHISLCTPQVGRTRNTREWNCRWWHGEEGHSLLAAGLRLRAELWQSRKVPSRSRECAALSTAANPQPRSEISCYMQAGTGSPLRFTHPGPFLLHTGSSRAFFLC